MKIKGLVIFIVLLLALTVFASECRGQVVYVPMHSEAVGKTLFEEFAVKDSTDLEKAEAYLAKIVKEAHKKDEKRKKIYKAIKYTAIAVIIIKTVGKLK